MNQFIKLILSVINQEDLKYPISKSLYDLFSFHSLNVYLYPIMDEKTTNHEIVKKVKSDYYQAIQKDTIQLNELETILNVFEENQIDVLPLKGSVMKFLYPETYYRSMGDIDILVKDKDYKKAKKILEKLNYKAKIYGEQHIEMEKPPFMIVELHHLLVAKKEYGKDIFKNIFKRAILKENKKHVYEMSKEDFYLFMMIHLLKHYLLGGTGLRSFLDVYVYLRKNEVMNLEYIDQQLQHCKYTQEIYFLKDLAVSIFTEKELDNKQQETLNFILTSGTYGLSSTLAQNELKETKNKSSKVILRKMFPTIESMKNRYPILNKVIILLPFTYIANIFRLMFNFNHSYQRAKELKQIEKENKSQKK